MRNFEKKLGTADLNYIKSDVENATSLIKLYSEQYKSKEHYEHLGSSCVMSATNTINTIINSAQYLNGQFLMADEINVEKVVDWFVKNRNFECDTPVLTFYMAHYLKRKINNLYRSISKGEYNTSLTIIGSKTNYKEFKTQCNKRRKIGVKPIR